jgi:DNA end-binding protein Ku
MRATKNASLSFGLVNVPVKVYKATDEKKFEMHMHHEADGGRIRQKKYCEVCKTEVTPDEIIKGVTQNGEVIQISKDEIAAIRPEKSAAIVITEFVPSREIESLYFSAHYFLGANKKAGNTKPFFLLREALRECGRVAIATVTLKEKEYVCAIQAYKNGFVLSLLNYESEIRNIGELSMDEPTLSDAELKLARQLISEHSVEQLDMSKFSDSFTLELEKLISAKANGVILEADEVQQVPQTKDDDLVNMLKASLGDVYAEA